MLNREQIKYLKKHSHSLKPVFQIGKLGESEEQLKSIEDYLYIHEIVKITVLNNSPMDRKYYVSVLEKRGITVVSLVGKIITAYKHSNYEDKKSTLRLP